MAKDMPILHCHFFKGKSNNHAKDLNIKKENVIHVLCVNADMRFLKSWFHS